MAKRSLKIYGMSGYQYNQVPAIMLKGRWLESLGFQIGDYVSVNMVDGKLVIEPDAAKKNEALFMKREMEKLEKRFEAEKKRIKAQYVAEQEAGYGI